jgi:tRNA(Glu) U13 pseudouridine synthase TruD
MVQYVKMFPARNEHDPNYEKFVEARKTKILQYVRQHSDLKLGELENKLLGIVSWF